MLTYGVNTGWQHRTVLLFSGTELLWDEQSMRGHQGALVPQHADITACNSLNPNGTNVIKKTLHTFPNTVSSLLVCVLIASRVSSQLARWFSMTVRDKRRWFKWWAETEVPEMIVNSAVKLQVKQHLLSWIWQICHHVHHVQQFCEWFFGNADLFSLCWLVVLVCGDFR